MDKESEIPAATAAGCLSGNETNYCYSDDDFLHSEGDPVCHVPGW